MGVAREERAEFVRFRILLDTVRPRVCAGAGHGEMVRRTPPDEEIRVWPRGNVGILHADLPELRPLLAMACWIDKIRNVLNSPTPDIERRPDAPRRPLDCFFGRAIEPGLDEVARA